MPSIRSNPGEQVNEPLEIAAHLSRGVPRLKREHRAPHQPEIRIEECTLETTADLLIL